MIGMNPAEFANIAKCERDFWWYRGTRAIMDRVMAPYLKDRTVGRVLEAGCGTGYLAQLLQKERGWTVVPLDVSEDGLRYARQMGVKQPVQGDACMLPFGANAFDLVFSMDVLPHLPPGLEGQAAKEMARVLSPGGLLILRVAALDILRSRHSAFAFEKQRFTRRRLTRLVEQAGLNVRRCTYANSLLMPVTLAKFRVWEPLLRKPPASGVEPMPPWLDSLLYQALAIEARFLGAGGSFPAGQSLVLIGEKPR
jgi:SAM-dependent methyltransferase